MQVGQLVSGVEEREKGTFPSQHVTNLKVAKLTKSNSAQINAIHMLRSRRQVDNHMVVRLIKNIIF